MWERVLEEAVIRLCQSGCTGTICQDIRDVIEVRRKEPGYTDTSDLECLLYTLMARGQGGS